MAKGRMLKKNISTSNKLAALKTDSARMLYVWLLPHLDVEGLYSADPDIIKGYILTKLTSWNSDLVESCLKDMAEVGLIILHETSTERFLQYPDFKKYQTLRLDRESRSEILPLIQDNSSIAPGVLPPISISRSISIKKNIGASKDTPTFFTLIQKYFTSTYKKKFGQEPAIDFGKEGRLVKSKQKLFASPEEAYGLIDFFLGSEKAERSGHTLAVCFTAHTINDWRVKNSQGNNSLSVNNPKWKKL